MLIRFTSTFTRRSSGRADPPTGRGQQVRESGGRPAPPAEPGHIRVSGADREQVATRLREAAERGELTSKEADECQAAAYAAVTRADPTHRPGPYPTACAACGASSSTSGSHALDAHSPQCQYPHTQYTDRLAGSERDTTEENPVPWPYGPGTGTAGSGFGAGRNAEPTWEV
ncbi:DUF1707 domain-containing protein [Frankia sp. Cppng1_Ct_nod]|uniref:DUF1707 domain-containing protein n=1 Tax=Frankia sp. Cppng1_Ct_nod TaxID=2897162 RepID=UPI0032E9D81B